MFISNFLTIFLILSHLLELWTFFLILSHLLELGDSLYFLANHEDCIYDEHDWASRAEEEADDRQDAHVAVGGGKCEVQHNHGNATILYCSLKRDGNNLK